MGSVNFLIEKTITISELVHDVTDMYAPGNFDNSLASVLLATPNKYHPPTLVALAAGDLLFNEGLA